MAAESFAVIQTGGRQLRVEPGQLVLVDRLGQSSGETVTFDKVLLVGTGEGVHVGAPQVDGAHVRAEVVGESRDRKVIVFKKKRRKGYRRTRGHRQWYTLIRIEAIEPGS
ncbi:MAG: 50S ribosomal protein L21 [Acidobacteriota bacterium]|nr:MAG: 50S ribosomal protein L21 [Acidobacteriota bacterium]